MNKLIKLLLLTIGLLVLPGCTYQDVSADPNYIELYGEWNSGWYVNAETPILVLDDTLLINMVEDERIVGDWLISIGDGDAILSFTEDNLILINNELFGEWYWGSSNVIMAIMYGEDQFNEPSISAIRFDFIDGSDDFAQFTEYDNRNQEITWLGIKSE